MSETINSKPLTIQEVKEFSDAIHGDSDEVVAARALLAEVAGNHEGDLRTPVQVVDESTGEVSTIEVNSVGTIKKADPHAVESAAAVYAAGRGEQDQ
ncbi:hypothetical protein KA025_03185 [Candidatus Saccharibacteria bacterium]|nr:hypothetical protein [Candidatus Saccharibacteria bacterium]MBP7835063.1 hypothetical protein [Candidatus Saccharibacteria bacterium]